MKQKALALILVLVLALGMLPLDVQAAVRWDLPAPEVAPMAIGELPQPQAQTYSVSLTYTGSGKAELYTKKAGAGESIYFLADPNPGYEVSFDKCGYFPADGQNKSEVRLIYIGANVYELVMPAGDVVLDLEFVKISTAAHNVKLTVGQGGMVTVDQKTAKKGESLFLEVITSPGYSQPNVRPRSGGKWQEAYYLGTVEGTRLYEVFMPDSDLEILVDFTRNGPYTVTAVTETSGGKLELSHKTAYELEKVTVTAKPDRGYRVSKITATRSALTKSRENVWTFTMPRHKEEVRVSFEAIAYPVRVSLEVPLGGKATANTSQAVIGQTVKLTCVPDEGYRVARITGVKNLKDTGGNTYTFVMDAAATEVKVLFLREENPFLDVSELDFYYEPVLWAAEQGITKGVDETHFGPRENCNRAQVVTFLWRAAGCPVPSAVVNPFTDVKDGDWYADAVLWAVEMGITNGLTADTFGPGAVCNRAQVVTFLHRALGSPAPAAQAHPFTDVKAGSFYEHAVLWALENGITTGVSGTAFSPEGSCLRAQVVTFLYRADQIPEPGDEA